MCRVLFALRNVYSLVYNGVSYFLHLVSSSTQLNGQFNNQTAFYTAYFDIRQIYFSDTQCTNTVYEVLTQFTLM